MNLANGPTKDPLRQLLVSCDDDAGDHIIWVDWAGNVHIDTAGDLTPSGWEDANKDRMKFRTETCSRGNKYLGEEAADSDSWVDSLFEWLTRCWETGTRGY